MLLLQATSIALVSIYSMSRPEVCEPSSGGGLQRLVGSLRTVRCFLWVSKGTDKRDCAPIGAQSPSFISHQINPY
jgi:hypothetical protein